VRAGEGTRHVHLVRGEDETCPVGTGDALTSRRGEASVVWVRARGDAGRERQGRRDETCPVSTGRGTRRVRLVRRGRGVTVLPCAPIAADLTLAEGGRERDLQRLIYGERMYRGVGSTERGSTN